MTYTFFDFVILIGSLALFLFGMKLMSEGLQKLAGERMRSFLGAMTKNSFFGIITGFLITSIIQSSSATTVMVVSFVNASLLNLTQAFGVILGANIGTTITAWLISILGLKVDIAFLSIPIIGLAFPLLFSKKAKLNYFAEFLIGFALLFMGLEYLKNAVPDLQENPEMFAFLQSFSDQGFLSVLIFIGIGTVLTMIIQSSSAAMALTLVMCYNGWISFADGAAMVLGENVGTTITAHLASLVGNTNAKRAALLHSIQNILNVLWVLVVFNLLLLLINKLVVSLGAPSPFIEAAGIPLALSIFHSFINIFNAVILGGFAKQIIKIPTFIIKENKTEKDSKQIEYIGSRFIQVPELSLYQAKNLSIKYAEISKRMFGFIRELLYEQNNKNRDAILERIIKYEEITDKVEQEITQYLINVSNKEVSLNAKERVRRMRILSIEIEKIGDNCHKVGVLIRNLQKEKLSFSQQQLDKIEKMFKLVEEAFEILLDNIEAEDRNNIGKAKDIEDRINKYRDLIRDELYEQFDHPDKSFKAGFFANKISTGCEKIADNIFNANEVVLGVNVE